MNDLYKNLPKKSAAAGALMFNDKGELLLVKPNYKDRWSIPGGVIENNESPKEACIREVKEEIGIKLNTATFLCVDYTPATKEKDETFQFMFYGGTIDSKQISEIKLQEKEIDEYRFVPIDRVESLLGGNVRSLAKRIPKCLEAIKTGTAVYLEDGRF
jgi:8-oxo-dGTP pyrophosphatase MutT (NUDIX family)